MAMASNTRRRGAAATPAALSTVAQETPSPTPGTSKKSNTAPKVVPGVGDEGCRLRSPSGVNMLPEWQQALFFIAVLVVLGICTGIYSWMLTAISANYAWFRSLRYSWPIMLGLFYAGIGITHFTSPEYHMVMYPARGAWGIWYLPGSKLFHILWTGVVEVAGGVGLIVGGVLDWVGSSNMSSPRIVSDAGMVLDCALMLFVLTWAVTPANIYIYTHGVKVSNFNGDIPLHIHVLRFFLQVVLLGLLWQLSVGQNFNP